MRVAEDVFPEVREYFDCALYTEAELEFIEKHLGESAYIALQGATDEDPAVIVAQHEDAAVLSRPNDKGMSAVKNFQATVGNALQRFHDLEQEFQAGGRAWCGFEEVRTHIAKWHERQRRARAHKERDPDRKGFAPELFRFRAGRKLWAAPGSDCGRVRFALPLVEIAHRQYTDFASDLRAEIPGNGNGGGNGSKPVESLASEGTVPTELVEHERHLQCPIDGCAHNEEFDPESTSSYNAARARMSRHMNKPMNKELEDVHKEARSLIFG